MIYFYCILLYLIDLIGLSVENSVKESTNFASTSTEKESDNFAKDTTDASNFNDEKSSPQRNVHINIFYPKIESKRHFLC